MRDFTRSGPTILMKLTDYEATLLESLVEQFCGLLETDAEYPDSNDPFVRWQAELDGAEPLDRSDPVITRNPWNLARTPGGRARRAAAPRGRSDGSARLRYRRRAGAGGRQEPHGSPG